MASFRAVFGVMEALETFLRERMPEATPGGPTIARPRILASKDFASSDLGDVLGLYLHRVTLDPTTRNLHRRHPPGSSPSRTPEHPFNLHFLLLAFASDAETEVTSIAWGMQQLASFPVIGLDRLAADELRWRHADIVQLQIEDMPTEDLMRIWDNLRADYTLSTPYVAKAVPVEHARALEEGPPVETRILEVEELTG